MPLVGWFSSGAGFPISQQGRTREELLFAKVSDMNLPGNEREIINTANTVSRATAKELGAYIFPKGTIIFPKVGGALLTNKRRLLTCDSCIDNNLMGFVASGPNLEFIFQLLTWLDLGKLAKPGPVPAISEGEVRDIRVSIPPSTEQAAIAEYVNKATNEIDSAIYKAQQEINLLNEYIDRLICDAVTGKLDVQNASAALPEDDAVIGTINSEDAGCVLETHSDEFIEVEN